ncbi:MAG: hypothetical protein GY799_23285, partial [Desulfobulbaceae bacterium]|nr:hypothetical protein [Desulfobulbaceae bacterium]
GVQESWAIERDIQKIELAHKASVEPYEKAILEMDNRSKRSSKIFRQAWEIGEAESVRLEKLSGVELINEHLREVAAARKQKTVWCGLGFYGNWGTGEK